MPYNTNILGWMTEVELRIIERLAKRVPNGGLIVEVGSMFGRSSVCWALSASHSAVYCIDMFYERYKLNHKFSDEVCKKHNFPESGIEYNIQEEFIRNTSGINNIYMIRGVSPDVAPEFNKEIDLFFLDAAHSNPSDWDNLNYFVPLIRSGGILCGHDYSEAFPDVVSNVNRISLQIDQPIETFTGSSMWCITIPEKVNLR